MNRKSRVIGLLSGLLLLTWLFTWTHASAADPHLKSVRDGILSFTDSVDAIAAPASSVLALTGYDPIGSDGLGLSNLVRDTFDGLPNTYDTPDDLKNALEGLDGTVAGVTVSVGSG